MTRAGGGAYIKQGAGVKWQNPAAIRRVKYYSENASPCIEIKQLLGGIIFGLRANNDRRCRYINNAQRRSLINSASI